MGGFHWGAWACVGGLHLAGVCAMIVLWLAGRWGTVLAGEMGGSGADALGLDIGRGVFALACGWVPAMFGRDGMVWQQLGSPAGCHPRAAAACIPPPSWDKCNKCHFT